MTGQETPGQLISELLEARGWTKRALAMVLGKDETTINKIIAGRGSVTTETALALEDVFGVAAEKFLELQRKYDLAVARISARPDKERAIRAVLFGDLPISMMVKRGWITVDDPKDLKAVESGLVDFFGVSTLNEIEIIPHAARKTMVNTKTSPAQLVWLYRVKAISEEMLVAKYSCSALERALPNLHTLTVAPEEARKVPRILAKCGIRFVIVESLPSTKIDGVCFWLNDAAPVVGLSMRYDRIDNFWFVLRHELEHVRLGHGRTAMMLDTELEGSARALEMMSPRKKGWPMPPPRSFAYQKRKWTALSPEKPVLHGAGHAGLSKDFRSSSRIGGWTTSAPNRAPRPLSATSRKHPG